jgi:hypothetical protein
MDWLRDEAFKRKKRERAAARDAAQDSTPR